MIIKRSLKKPLEVEGIEICNENQDFLPKRKLKTEVKTAKVAAS